MSAPPPSNLIPAPAASASLRRAGLVAIAVATLLMAGAGLRAWSNAQASQQLAADTAQDGVRQVLTIQAKPGAAARGLTLPATLRGEQEAALYARASGYLQRWTKDIGDSVRKGELLAVIDAPESDQELQQARAALEQVRARLALTQSSLQRWEGLRARDAVPQQELDERRAAHQQAGADQAAAQANVQRLEELQRLRRVVAPFDGVVLRRYAEVGTLITANATTGRALYDLAQIDRLRIDLAVPQSAAADVQVGQAVKIRWPERPGLVVEGSIQRTAPGIDTATRTRQVTIALPNPERKLLPGSYVDVQLADAKLNKDAKTSDRPRALSVPPGVLQFRQEGPRVALVQNDRIVLRNVKLGRDFGRSVEVLEGLRPQDHIVLNPPDALIDGERVQAQAAPDSKPGNTPDAKPESKPGKARS